MHKNEGIRFFCFIKIHAFDKQIDSLLMANTACRDAAR